MKRVAIVTFTVLLLGALYSAGTDQNGLSTGQRIVGAPLLLVLRPLQDGFRSAAVIAISWIEGIFNGARLVEENKRLQRHVDGLQSALRRTEGLRAENERLRAMLRVKEELTLRTESARVVGSDAGGLPRTWIIALQPDSKAGVGSFVMTERGVVGHIIRKSGRFADVLPLNDAIGRAGAVVFPSGDEGVVMGDGTPLLHLAYLSPHARVNPNDEVLTSGDGGVYPRGLPIGRIRSVNKDKDRPVITAVVSPYESGRMLDIVLVGNR